MFVRSAGWPGCPGEPILGGQSSRVRRYDAQIGIMLFVLCVALLNLAIGYAAGLYWGPVSRSLGRRRTDARLKSTIDGTDDPSAY